MNLYHVHLLQDELQFESKGNEMSNNDFDYDRGGGRNW